MDGKETYYEHFRPPPGHFGIRAFVLANVVALAWAKAVFILTNSSAPGTAGTLTKVSLDKVDALALAKASFICKKSFEPGRPAYTVKGRTAIAKMCGSRMVAISPIGYK